MRCDCCPLCPIAEDDVCLETEGEHGIEHSDGMLGCRHPRNWVDKKNQEHDKYLGDMGTDMGIEMSFSQDDLKRVIELCKHMVGLDYHKPYHRHGKAFYKAYRNYYTDGISGNPLLDKLCGVLGIMRKEQGRIGTLYALTQYGLKWLGRRLNITIKD